MIKTYEIDFDDELVCSAEKIFGELGTDIDTAINIFLKQAVLRKGFPFEVVIPDEKSENELTEQVDSKEESLENKNCDIHAGITEEEECAVATVVAFENAKTEITSENATSFNEPIVDEDEATILENSTDSENTQITEQSDAEEETAQSEAISEKNFEQNAKNSESEAEIAPSEPIAEEDSEQKAENSDFENENVQPESVAEGIIEQDVEDSEDESKIAPSEPIFEEDSNSEGENTKSKSIAEENTEDSEDEDETAPENLFDSWDEEK